MTIIISLCLLLIAYLFDLTAAKDNVCYIIITFRLDGESNLLFWYQPSRSYRYFTQTIGLILIVLEGSLELELNKSKVDW
jgi:hypothetical protein